MKRGPILHPGRYRCHFLPLSNEMSAKKGAVPIRAHHTYYSTLQNKLSLIG